MDVVSLKSETEVGRVAASGTEEDTGTLASGSTQEHVITEEGQKEKREGGTVERRLPNLATTPRDRLRKRALKTSCVCSLCPPVTPDVKRK